MILKDSPQRPTEKNLFWRLIDISRSLSSEHDKWKLYEKILLEGQKVSKAEGSTLYLLNPESKVPCLEYVIARNDPLNLSILNRDHHETGLKPLPLYDKNLAPDHNHISTHCALTKQTINLDDVYHTDQFDISGIKAFDIRFNYRTHSVLTVPLKDHDNHVIGVVQLINAKASNTANSNENSLDNRPFNEETVQIIEALCSLAAMVIDNTIMMDEQRDLLIRLASKKETELLFETILDEAQTITNAEGGTLYLLNETGTQPTLDFAILKNSVLNIHLGGTASTSINFPPLNLYDETGAANHKSIATYTALSKQLINIPDAYNDQTFDFSGTRAFDSASGYRSTSFLSVPLANHAQDIIGVLQLVNARDSLNGKIIPFDRKVEPLIKALGTYAAIALENQILLEDHKKLLEAFIQCIAKAIDAKSSHTSAHCQRVPELTKLISEATCNDTHYFPDFNLDEDEKYELEVAAWMHDCGKLATPDSILDKSTKLHQMRDGIDAINARFESFKKEIQIQILEGTISGELQSQKIAALQEQLESIASDQAFVNAANKGGEFMSPESQHRIKDIACYQWTNHLGEKEPILNEEETYNLCIPRGTLNDKERSKINDHMRVTIDMLESLPFPKTLRKVPEFAGGHHEKMDGTGFPKGLTRDQMSLPARMMAIADIFEALTSKDRPYKDPMKISQALSILRNMRDQNHIDPDLFQVFLEQRVWEVYAKAYLNPDQLDVTDIESYR